MYMKLYDDRCDMVHSLAFAAVEILIHPWEVQIGLAEAFVPVTRENRDN